MNINLSTFNLTNKSVAVAVSGGEDSMALLCYMLSVKEKYAFTVKAINVEHGIRGESSINDSAFVETFCKNNNIPLKSYKVNSLEYAKNNKLSVEQSARLLRYGCFDDAVNCGFTDYIMTAHHKSDNLETVLFNLCRGSALKGLTGIEQVNGYIIRPLLSVTKEEIKDYIKKNGIPFVQDETNFSNDYTRNYLRNEVVPKLKTVFPEVENSVCRFSTIAKEEDEFLDEQARKIITLKDNAVFIPLTTHPVLLKRASIIAFKHLGIVKDYESLHAKLIENLTLLNNGCALDLPKQIKAIKEYDNVVIYKDIKFDFSPTPFCVGKYKTPYYDLIVTTAKKPNDIKKDGALYLDLEKLPKDVMIRKRKDGDVFTKFGGKTKKLKDYLIDIKYPKRLRDGLLVGAVENEIFFIAGIEISDKVKVDETTVSVLKLECK